MQRLVAVEATAEGDEDGGVGRPHSRPGRAGPAERVFYFYQAPGPNPAHYHQDSCGPSRPGREGHREGGGGEGQGGREKEGSWSVSLAEGGENETGDGEHKQGEEEGRGGELERE